MAEGGQMSSANDKKDDKKEHETLARSGRWKLPTRAELMEKLMETIYKEMDMVHQDLIRIMTKEPRNDMWCVEIPKELSDKCTVRELDQIAKEMQNDCPTHQISIVSGIGSDRYQLQASYKEDD
jgi:hypothetical protein